MVIRKINSEIDNLPLSVMISSPEKTPKGIVQLVHGMCEHKERYIPFMQHLSSNGYICVIHDHRGHGESILSKADLGYFYDAGYRGMIEDTHQVSKMIKEMYPDLKLSLLGHSMGSLVVRSYAKQYDHMLDHLIVCGSPSYEFASKIGILFARIVGTLKGSHHRSKMISNIIDGKFRSLFKNETSHKSWICTDPEVIKLYDTNPKCGFIFTANGYENLFKLMNDTYSRKGWSVSKPDLPILFIAGENDPCIINSGKFKTSIHKMSKVGYKNIKHKLYPNMRHEVLNEINKEEVWKDVLSFLE